MILNAIAGRKRGGGGRGSERTAVAGRPCPPVPGTHPSQVVEVAVGELLSPHPEASQKCSDSETQFKNAFLCGFASLRLGGEFCVWNLIVLFIRRVWPVGGKILKN